VRTRWSLFEKDWRGFRKEGPVQVGMKGPSEPGCLLGRRRATKSAFLVVWQRIGIVLMFKCHARAGTKPSFSFLFISLPFSPIQRSCLLPGSAHILRRFLPILVTISPNTTYMSPYHLTFSPTYRSMSGHLPLSPPHPIPNSPFPTHSVRQRG